jgi:hypothetical protein
MKILTKHYRLILTALLVSVASLSVQGGDHTWSGGGSNGYWSNPANWNSGGAPVAGEANSDLNTTNWVTIGTANADAAGLLQFVDPNASNFPQHFYRLITQ